MTCHSWLPDWLEFRLFLSMGKVFAQVLKCLFSNVLKFVESTSQKACTSCDYASCQVLNRFPVLFWKVVIVSPTPTPTPCQVCHCLLHLNGFHLRLTVPSTFVHRHKSFALCDVGFLSSFCVFFSQHFSRVWSFFFWQAFVILCIWSQRLLILPLLSALCVPHLLSH